MKNLFLFLTAFIISATSYAQLNCSSLNPAMNISVSGATATVTNNSTPTSTTGLSSTYNVYWGDGTWSTINNPNTHSYNVSGTYTVTLHLYVHDSTFNISCHDSVKQNISINLPPLVCNANFNTSSAGLLATLYNTSYPTPGNGVYTDYRIYWGDGQISYANNQSWKTHMYASGGTYNIILSTTNIRGIDTCWSNDTGTITITAPPPPSTIGGLVILDTTTLAQPTDSIKVWLISFDSSTNILSAVDSTIVIAAPYPQYSFYNVPNGSYRTKAKLLNGQTSGTGYLPTYHDSALLWSNATVINHGGGNNYGNNISLKTGTVTAGPGFIGGNVTQGANKGTSSGIAGLEVLLLDAGNKPVAFTTTDANGDYTFTKLVSGTYKIHPENMNYTTTPAVLTLTTNDYTRNGIDFERSESKHTITPKPTGITDINNAASGFSIYPNPAHENVTIRWDATSQDNATVTITDISGKIVAQKEVTMNNNITVNTTNIQAGLYFLTVSTEGYETVQKLIIE